MASFFKIRSLVLISILSLSQASLACESSPVKILAIGDSQTGATWAQSYYGNFLQECLGDSFVVYGRGGTIPSHWIDLPGMDKIDTIQRDPKHPHLNIGALEKVPLCKKRLSPMIKTHTPKKVLVFFGDNLMGHPDKTISREADRMVSILKENGFDSQSCFFLTPSFEMEVKSKRNVPSKNIDNTTRVNRLIKSAIAGRCKFIDGLEIMKDSPYLHKQLLERVSSPGKTGCMGKAENDNIHLCGEAAKEFAQKVCKILK